jgi:hypothetical protein
MTDSERDFDRIARAWLDQGPIEAPERAVAAVLQAIEATPQVRRPFRWPTWRSPTMLRFSLLAIVGAAILVTFGALALSGGAPALEPDPAPPSATPSPTPSTGALGPVPDAVKGGWVASSRGTSVEDPTVTTIVLGGSAVDRWAPEFSIDIPDDTRQLGSDVVELEPGVLRFGLSNAGDSGCQMRDIGTYRWSVSADGQWLTLDRIDDACSVRGDILAGTWQRSLAFSSQGGPGVAVNFQPFVTFTLPAGLYTGQEYAGDDQVVIDRSDASYKIWKDLDGFVDPCDISKGRLDIAPGMDALLAYIEGDPRFRVVRRDEYQLDGHRAVELEFTTGADIEPPCWTFDGNPDDRSGVLTWVTGASPSDWFWNNPIKGRGQLVITEVDGATLAFEWAVQENGLWKVDRETLDTVRFLDTLPIAP